eukprot:TRINITY_DN3633_c0_g1_i3.p1 TRINITY_DN3633_c0_g1~~TRINITY_DN3633_c0_g1_i3.p1  ORF type:complete len:991 (-),score=181.41 TRINITY_DN3633_c0_g1_i3:14-2986(-)
MAHAFGSCTSGQIGLSATDENFPVPTPVKLPVDTAIVAASCGGTHSALVLASGALLTAGDNCQGQLGRDGRQTVFCRVDRLEAFDVCAVACGLGHTLAAESQEGRVVVWGQNSHGQLGLGDKDQREKPKVLSLAAGVRAVQVAAAERHSLVLSAGSQLWLCGSGKDGQIAPDYVDQLVFKPEPILRGVPIRTIACGAAHNLVVSWSGLVFGWGANSHGQLGLGDNKTRTRPEQLRGVSAVMQIAGGSHHSAAVDDNGQLWCWGADGDGQTGHGRDGSPVMRPMVVQELLDRGPVAAVGCGARHTLAVMCSGTVVGFGSNSAGQLGLGECSGNVSNPRRVAPDVPRPECASIVAGGSCSLLLASAPASQTISHLNLETVRAMVAQPAQHPQLSRLCREVHSSAACLSASFVIHEQRSSRESSGVDFEAARQVYGLLFSEQAPGQLVEVIRTATAHLVRSLVPRKPALSWEALRVLLVLSENPLMLDPAMMALTLEHLAVVLLGLPSHASDTLKLWWSKLDSPYFARTVRVWQHFLSFQLSKGLEQHVANGVAVLAMLHRINEQAGLVPTELFHNKTAGAALSPSKEISQWLHQTNVFSFCQYPFLMDVGAKKRLMDEESRSYMQQAMQHAAAQHWVLALKVHRDNLVRDTIEQLATNQHNFRKPLQVQFVGEEGLDYGGVRKEFFQVLTRHCFGGEHTGFSTTDTQRVWFRKDVEDPSVYSMAGTIVGLAIYNGVTCNVPFPMILYRRLLHRIAVHTGKVQSVEVDVRLQDLVEVDSELARNLETILSIQGDMQAVLPGLDFTISTSHHSSVELVHGRGSNLVNQLNKHEYVDAYARYVLVQAVDRQFEAFAAGFLAAVPLSVVTLLEPEELGSLLVGSVDWDIWGLKAVTKYEGYEEDHAVIQWFWGIVSEFSERESRQLLSFVSGSDRVPVQGIETIPFVIQRSEAIDQLPTSHTCFNILDLPCYDSAEKLNRLLRLAISEGAEGFGFV